MVLKKISAIIFDLDNTLYSEEKFYYEYFKIFCKKFNYPFKKFILKFNIKKQIFKIENLKNALLRINRYNKINHDKSFKLLISFKSEIKLFKGVLNTLSFLRKNNIKIGILTNGSIQLQKKKIKDLNIAKKIDKIVYAKKFKKQKPYSYSFIGILKLLRIKPHDVIFIGDVGIGEGMLTSDQAELLKGLVENQASGIVFIPGWQGNQFSLLENELGGLMPVVLDEALKSGQEEATDSPLSLTSEGRSSLLTMLGDTEEENPNIWRSLPGFYWHAPVVRAKSGTEVLAVHANRRHPKYGHRIPLIVTSRAGNGKVLFMGIDSAWRWRRGVEDLYHYRFWGQVARWMSYQRNMAAGERVRLYFTPERPLPGENVTINANAFQENGAPLEEGSVLIDLTAPDGSVRRFELAKEDGTWGSFTGRFKVTMPGDWIIAARTSESEEGAVKTRIIAEGAQIEKTGHPARPDVLAELSRVSRGRVVEASQLEILAQEIYDLPEPRPQVIPESQWDKWYVAAGLMGLLAIFWIGRKLNGTF